MMRAAVVRDLVALGGATVIACATLAGQASRPTELLPVDEAVQRPEFFTFRAHLQAAVARRDWTALLAVVHPNIRNSFGPDEGLTTFREQWREGAPDSPIWSELGAVLALGGSFDAGGSFVAPYVFSRWPGSRDAFEHVAVAGSRVRVRASARPDADVLAIVSYAILPRARAGGVLLTDDEGRWTSVALPDGRAGYVAARYARSPIDYRAIFSEASGRWQMMAFVAGD